MAGKIFFRERRLAEDGAGQPRFQLVAIVDCDLHIYGKHLRMAELKAIAVATGANLVRLPQPLDGNVAEEAKIASWLLDPARLRH